MAKPEGGIKAAAKMLAGLDPKNRQRILLEIAGRDPVMAESLKKAIVSFDDLQRLSIKQLQELLREVKIADLALGLRAASVELKDFFYHNLPKSLLREIDDILLGPPQPLERVLEAQEKVLTIVRAKLDRGELVFSDQNDEMV